MLCARDGTHTLGGFFEVARTRLRLTVEPSRRAAFGGFCLAKHKSFRLPCSRASQWTTTRVRDGLPNRMTQQFVRLFASAALRFRAEPSREPDEFHFHKNCYHSLKLQISILFSSCCQHVYIRYPCYIYTEYTTRSLFYFSVVMFVVFLPVKFNYIL